ncbi:AsmA family protein, partial [Oharaeibacter diazotrophicus]|uniref:AsmA family protein n=1 Tax=Oharaeibacter diazotrophicus TaxID=1920512 RepID=UPI0013F5E45A
MVRIVAGLFALLAILVVAVLAVPFVVPADWIRAQVVAAVEGATGFRLALDGPVSFTLVPEPALEAVDVGVAAGDAPEFARVGTVRFGLALAPLIDRRVEVTGLTLQSPRLVLTVDADGPRNWVPAMAAGKAAAP